MAQDRFHERRANAEGRDAPDREGDEHGSGAERHPTEARQGAVIKRRPMTRVLVMGIMLVVIAFALVALIVFWGAGPAGE